MNSIEALKRDIERAVPGVETKLRKSRKETGTWWLDAKRHDHRVAVQWSAHHGFGISTDNSEDGYGEGADEVLSDREAAAQRVIHLLMTGTRSVPPAEVLLRDLRAAVGFTQEQLANRLGIQQAAVSRLERRSDMTLSSLRRYVQALGGELEINVRTLNGERVKLLESSGKAKASATCEDAANSLARTENLLPEAEVPHLTEMLTKLLQAATSRWTLTSAESVSLRSDPSANVACAHSSEGTISINTRMASLLASHCIRLCAHMLSPNGAVSEAVYRYLLGHEIGHLLHPSSFIGEGCPTWENAELTADAVAGCLAAVSGDDPVAGSVASSLLGCRVSGCSHPTPEQRTLAFLSGHSWGLRKHMRASARMNLFVLRVSDLEVSRVFYEGLGLALVRERHGNGPIHYACNMQDTVMELYPCARNSPLPSKLRFGIQAAKDTLGRLQASGVMADAPQFLRRTAHGDVYLLRDPDKNSIELEVAD